MMSTKFNCLPELFECRANVTYILAGLGQTVMESNRLFRSQFNIRGFGHR